MRTGGEGSLSLLPGEGFGGGWSMGVVPGEERCQGPQKAGGEEEGGGGGEGAEKEQQISRFLKSCSERALLLGWSQGTVACC